MTFRALACTLLTLALCTLSAQAQEQGAWRAASKSADSVTSDIALSSERISIDFIPFPMAQLRAVTPAELKAVFDLDAEPAGGRGNLYKLNIPATRKFVRKNSLCGTEDVQYMVAWPHGKELRIAFFSGAKLPELTAEAMFSGSSLCGVYAYVR
jgi:hypothetical protein